MKRNGFTLIELIITVAIAAIVLAIGVPSFRTTILNNTRTTLSNDLIGAISLARSEAAKSGFKTVICRSVDGVSCSITDPGAWKNGWILFSDRNQNNTVDAGEVLKVYSAINSNFTLNSGSSFSQWIAYRSSGIAEGDTVLSGQILGVFRLCDSRGVDEARFVEISNTGRPSVRPKASGDVCP